jgi:hypothetical protein
MERKDLLSPFKLMILADAHAQRMRSWRLHLAFNGYVDEDPSIKEPLRRPRVPDDDPRRIVIREALDAGENLGKGLPWRKLQQRVTARGVKVGTSIKQLRRLVDEEKALRE